MKNGTLNRERGFVRLVLTPSAVPPSESSSSSVSTSWTFFSNHAHVLVCLSRDGDPVLRDVALEVGITERAVQKIISELEAAGVIKRKKVGRRNSYSINKRARLRHSIEAHRTVGDLLKFVISD